MGKRANHIQRPKPAMSLPRKKAKQFYQTRKWRNFRERYRKEKRREHEEVSYIYKCDTCEKTIKKDFRTDEPIRCDCGGILEDTGEVYCLVMDVYKSNPENKPEDLVEFLHSDNPLSEPHLKKGIIKVASILDHKKRIRAGGAKFAKSNLQWVDEEYHRTKSAKEAHE